ncbi:MAG: sigma-70 family RNA polymerase sigma factor [Clostridiaceae bacterium]|nr:sigma-70 family RNA polymerase sigma factor [Clostridiaceae bacterium]
MFQRPDRPDILIEKIQAGDELLRNQFIAESVPEIKHWVRRITHSFFAEQEDEFSIALEGFNQAIDRYSHHRQVPFYSYAYLIIKHRLYDWIRRNKTHQHVLPFTDCDSADGLSIEDQLCDPKSGQFSQNLEIHESLLQLEWQLGQFGFSLSGITAGFPKHRDSQSLCVRVARQLADDDELYTHLLEKHRLPGAELARRCQVPVKTIEKNRPGIILLTLLMRSDLQVIRSYITVFGEASK